MNSPAIAAVDQGGHKRPRVGLLFDSMSNRVGRRSGHSPVAIGTAATGQRITVGEEAVLTPRAASGRLAWGGCEARRRKRDE
jgi:hypothetical protein